MQINQVILHHIKALISKKIMMTQHYLNSNIKKPLSIFPLLLLFNGILHLACHLQQLNGFIKNELLKVFITPDRIMLKSCKLYNITKHLSYKHTPNYQPQTCKFLELIV